MKGKKYENDKKRKSNYLCRRGAFARYLLFFMGFSHERSDIEWSF